jgi:hypothetical protein
MNPILCRALARLSLGAACALVPFFHAAAEPARCSFTPIGKLPLRYSGPSLEITTQGTINGTPAELLVDTGMYQTALTRTGTERRGIRAYATGRRATGIGGSSPVYASIVNEFIVGPVRAGRSNMPVLGSFGYTPSYDGILGAPFLFQTDVEISLAAKELTFFVPERCGDTFLGYWGGNISALPLRRHNQNHMNPQFLVRVNGKELEAMIDSGGDLVGDETVENAEMAVVDSGLNEVDVTLGADFLRAHRVLFAMSQTKLYFSYVGGEPFGQGRTLEPWVVAEAESGNADAQMTVAEAYARGKLVPRDEARAFDWLEKAAKGGSGHANLLTGRKLLKRQDYATAAPRGAVGDGRLAPRAGATGPGEGAGCAAENFVQRVRWARPA